MAETLLSGNKLFTTFKVTFSQTLPEKTVDALD